MKTLRVTPSNVQVRLRKEKWSEIESRRDSIDIWACLSFLAKLACNLLYVFMRFYVNIICFYYVY